MTPVDSTINPAESHPRAERTCMACGVPWRAGANFCRGCGAAQPPDDAPTLRVEQSLWASGDTTGTAAPVGESWAAPPQKPRPERSTVPAPPAPRAGSVGLQQSKRSPREIERRRQRTRNRLAAVMVAVLAIGVGAAALLLIVLPRQREADLDRQLQQIAAGATRSISSLDGAARDGRPDDAGSLVALRAAATRTAQNLGAARTDLKALQPRLGKKGQQGGELKDALVAAQALARTLGRSSLTASTVEGLSARAGKSASEVTGLKLPAVNTQSLVTALKARDRAAGRARIRAQTRARAERRRAARRRRAASAPVAVTAPSTGAAGLPALRLHTGLGYQAQIPSGDGWSAPIDSEPTPRRLFRTTVRGPGGMVLLIDYTPEEPAVFGGSSMSRREVGQTAFGSATEFIFQGGAVPECQRSRCIDYIVNDRGSGAGFGVLAGGPDFQTAQLVGDSVMQSLRATASG